MMGLTLELHSLKHGLARVEVTEMRARVEELKRAVWTSGRARFRPSPISRTANSELLRTLRHRSGATCGGICPASHGATIDFRDEGVPDDVPTTMLRWPCSACYRRRWAMPSDTPRWVRVSVSLGGSRDELRLDVADEESDSIQRSP